MLEQGLIFLYFQNQDKKVVVAEGFDMKAVVMNSTATQFIIRSKPLQEVSLFVL